jgi:hypothetical protein
LIERRELFPSASRHHSIGIGQAAGVIAAAGEVKIRCIRSPPPDRVGTVSHAGSSRTALYFSFTLRYDGAGWKKHRTEKMPPH